MLAPPIVDFCTRPTKNRGDPRCVTYFRGVPGCVTKCDRGRRGQNWPKIALRTLSTAPNGDDRKFAVGLQHTCTPADEAILRDGIRMPYNKPIRHLGFRYRF